MLRADAQVLADGAELGADVLPQDVGRPRGGREQARQDGPIRGGGQRRRRFLGEESSLKDLDLMVLVVLDLDL